ncbi:hypothetical protein RJ640_024408 [Escallonia rubra]|uniref:NADP-dependent oxidoreductase domain-containing protein n=1 Tax=Escallonia rubra TaxID=112253 RepID=A0AA88UCN3_9ASTE|nr:hypothetical protein RJ640_024408 [Escallonia rubra]
MLLRDLAIRHPKVITPKCPSQTKDGIIFNRNLFNTPKGTVSADDTLGITGRGGIRRPAGMGFEGTFWGDNRIVKCNVLVDIAKAKGKTTAQVSLRWLYEQGVSIIAKSFNKDRMRENLQIFGWSLTEEDTKRIGEIPHCKGVLVTQIAESNDLVQEINSEVLGSNVSKCASYSTINMTILVVHEFSHPKASNNSFELLIQKYLCSSIYVDNFWLVAAFSVSSSSGPSQAVKIDSSADWDQDLGSNLVVGDHPVVEVFCGLHRYWDLLAHGYSSVFFNCGARDRFLAKRFLLMLQNETKGGTRTEKGDGCHTPTTDSNPEAPTTDPNP